VRYGQDKEVVTAARALVAVEWTQTGNKANPIIGPHENNYKNKNLSIRGHEMSELQDVPRNLVVLDLGMGMDPALVTNILVEASATIIRAEPAAGDPFYNVYPAYQFWRGAKEIETIPAQFAPRLKALLAKADVYRVGGEDYPGTAWRFNTESILVDMKSKDGAEIVRHLCLNADAVTNNFRPGVSARLGVDPDSLRRLKPGLIVLKTTGYGSSGPSGQRPGYDMVLQSFCWFEDLAGGKGSTRLHDQNPKSNHGVAVTHDDEYGDVALRGQMFKLSRWRLTGQSMVPSPGGNSSEILLDFGFSAAMLKDF
jgi:crotonobetainyl-CoA:carnitine CoA-transferase CaiB-like acyl-CoA transferase